MDITLTSFVTSSTSNACAVLLGSYIAWRTYRTWYSLSHIPTAFGSDLPVLSWIGALKFVFNAKAITNDAYAKHKGGIYKVAVPEGWKVVLCSPELIEELRGLPDSVLSFPVSGEQFLQTEFMISHRAAHDGYQTELVKTVLSKKLESIFPHVYDEIAAAFLEGVPCSGEDWVAVDANTITRLVICRASNRMLVGLPLCRDPDWVQDNIAFTVEWILHATIIRIFPKFLRRTVARLINPIPKKIARAREMLLPTIEHHRVALEATSSDDSNRPNDFLAWMLENAKGDATRAEPQILTEWIKVLNFASVETSSMAFTHILYDLAAHPEFVEVIRDEAQLVIRNHGWTKAAMSALVQLDSFMRESMRVNRSSLAATRKCLKKHTFNNGVTIPRGVNVEVATAMMEDKVYCPNAQEFLPFRYVSEGSSVTPKQFTTVSPENLLFGIGRHACPGRFFASLEIKAMLAHIVLSYDVRTEIPGARPKNFGFGPQELPAQNSKVLFRRRYTE